MPAIIQIENLTKHYDMGAVEVRALQGVSLTIERNDYVAIMGPSGSGKSTLMNIIGCLDISNSGTYVLNSRRVDDMADDELADIRNKEIGFVFQTFHLLPRSDALRNVELPLIYTGMSARERRERAEEVLTAVGLADRMYHRPNELSGGEKQRVAVARALSNQPALILADEPTGALDTRTGEEIMDLFNRLHADGNTIILVTHEPHIATHSHRILRLLDGLVESDLSRQPGNGRT